MAVLVRILTYLLLNGVYIVYAQISGDERVESNLSFYFLINLCVLGIIYGSARLQNMKRRSTILDFMILFWSFAFYVNSFKLLELQIKWDSIGLAYMIYLLPIVAFLSTLLFSNGHNKIPLKDRQKTVLTNVIFVLFAISYLLLIYEISITGIIPIIMDNIGEARLEYGLPGIHVVSEAFLKLAFYFSVYLLVIVKNKSYKNKSIIVLTILYFVITFSRSGLMQIGLFSMIIYTMRAGGGLVQLNTKKALALVSLLLVFSLLGNIRQGEDFNINEYTASKIDNSAVNWLYGYYFVNFDNLALSIVEDPIYFEGKRSFMFLTQLLGNKLSQEDFDDYSYIGRVNLGTGFRDFTLDWGMVLGTGALSFLVFVYMFFMNSIQTDLYTLYKCLFLTYVALFPMVNRLSDFIPFFISVFIVGVDLMLRAKVVLPIPLTQKSF